MDRSDLVRAAGTNEPEPGDECELVVDVFDHRAEVFGYRAKADLVDLDLGLPTNPPSPDARTTRSSV
jgi:hypothetical protein